MSIILKECRVVVGSAYDATFEANKLLADGWDLHSSFGDFNLTGLVLVRYPEPESTEGKVLMPVVQANALQQNNRDLWDALNLVRQEVEEHVPVTAGEQLEPTPAAEAQAIVEAIRKIAEGAMTYLEERQAEIDESREVLCDLRILWDLGHEASAYHEHCEYCGERIYRVTRLIGHADRCGERCGECRVHLPSHGRHATGCSRYRWPEDGERRRKERRNPRRRDRRSVHRTGAVYAGQLWGRRLVVHGPGKTSALYDRRARAHHPCQGDAP